MPHGVFACRLSVTVISESLTALPSGRGPFMTQESCGSQRCLQTLKALPSHCRATSSVTVDTCCGNGCWHRSSTRSHSKRSSTTLHTVQQGAQLSAASVSSKGDGTVCTVNCALHHQKRASSSAPAWCCTTEPHISTTQSRRIYSLLTASQTVQLLRWAARPVSRVQRMLVLLLRSWPDTASFSSYSARLDTLLSSLSPLTDYYIVCLCQMYCECLLICFYPFSALTLLFGWQRVHPAGKNSYASNPQTFIFERPTGDPA